MLCLQTQTGHESFRGGYTRGSPREPVCAGGNTEEWHRGTGFEVEVEAGLEVARAAGLPVLYVHGRAR